MLQQPNTPSLNVLARGDCTSRRAFALNPELAGRYTFKQNEKSPFVLFLDAAKNISVTPEYLDSISHVSNMPKSLAQYYIGQSNRSILGETGADLLVIDSYADMNFELWERNDGAKFWIHPAHLKDRENFNSSHTPIGRRTLDQSLAEAEEFIAIIRKNNPDIPVLILNQQTDYYPKLDSRKEYYQFGKLLAQRVPNSYFGGVEPKSKLELADVGSCGPGCTLHFMGPTYGRMLKRAMRSGLNAALRSRAAQQQPVGKIPAGETITVKGDKAPVPISFRAHEGTYCSAAVDRAISTFDRYMVIPDQGLLAPYYTTMVIALEEILNGAWLERVKRTGGGARLRQAKKAERLGYRVARFPWKLYIPDIHEINVSKDHRSGGTMRESYRRTVDQMGGAPTKHLAVEDPACHLHWDTAFGVFRHEPGYAQGSVVTDQKLVGYIATRRIGDVLLYSQILGHGDHLADGVMILLHHKLIEWISENTDFMTKGLRFVMYGGAQNGGDGLRTWKERSGFVPQDLIATR